MVPPNQTLIDEKIDSLFRCLERVREKTPATLEELLTDLDRQDIIVLNLERAIQICVDIAAHLIAYTPLTFPPTMAQSFESLASAGLISHETSERMKKAVGLRNILVHEYKRVDWSIVWEVITHHLDDMAGYAQQVSTARPPQN
jgi:uncharacterized protein YutE (UPF0331/DUF86 family)